MVRLVPHRTMLSTPELVVSSCVDVRVVSAIGPVDAGFEDPEPPPRSAFSIALS